MAGLLGVSLLALAVDRLVPAESHASPVASVHTDGAEPVSHNESLHDDRGSGPTLADRFAGFDAGERPAADIDDAFAPMKSAAEEASRAQPESASGETGLRLSAVLRREDGDIAVINGRPMRIGEEIDGIRVVSIDAQDVHLETGVGTVVLKLPMPTLQAK